jgi:hypothetical protein
MKNLIRKILKEEVNKKYPKPTPKMEQLVYGWLDNYFEGSQMYDDEVWDNHRFDFEFCKNGRDIAELITEFEDESPDWGPQDERPLSERKFKESSLHIYPVMVDELLSDIPIRRHYLIYLIEEWFEDTYLDKIQRILNRNDLHLDRVSVSTYKREGGVCVPPIKTTPEDVTEEDMIQHILKTTLYKRNEILKHEEEKPGWIEKTYLQKLRSDEYDRLNRQ